MGWFFFHENKIKESLFSMSANQNSSIKSLLLFSVCSLIFFLLPNCSAWAEYNDKNGFTKAAKLLNSGKYPESIGMYKEIIANSANKNNRARALLFTANTYSLYLDQQKTALQKYNELIKKYSGTFSEQDAIFNCGMIYFEQNNYVKAYEYFTNYKKKFPEGMRFQSTLVWADSSKSLINTKTEQKVQPEKLYVDNTSIRVLIVKNSKYINLDSTKPIKVISSNSGQILYHNKGHVNISLQKNTLFINSIRVNLKGRLYLSSASFSIKVNNKAYRGFFSIDVKPSGIDFVNHVDVEQYLLGVIPKEMPYTWPMQALMAQAVAARTYALYVKEKSSDKPYDIEATVASQVYGGYDAEKKETSSAVKATAGEVLTCNRRLIIAYFHSHSGGYTEDPKNVWSANVPYLNSIPDKFSINSSKRDWDCFFTYLEIEGKLKKANYDFGKIDTLTYQGRSKSGRILNIKLLTDKGASVISGNNFRIALGSSKLKSTMFSMSKLKTGILFKGKGYGHGVGMSQWGALNMSRTKYLYKQILKYYYQKAELTKLSS